MNRPHFLRRRTILRERLAVTLEEGTSPQTIAPHIEAMTRACRFFDLGPLVRENEARGWRCWRYRSPVTRGEVAVAVVRADKVDPEDRTYDDVIVRWTRGDESVKVTLLEQEDMLWGFEKPRGRRSMTGLLLAAALRDVTTALSDTGVVSMDDAEQAGVAARLQSHRYHSRGKQSPCPYAAMGPVFRPDYRSLATAVGADERGVTIRRISMDAIPEPDDIRGLLRAAGGEQAVRNAVAAARASC